MKYLAHIHLLHHSLNQSFTDQLFQPRSKVNVPGVLSPYSYPFNNMNNISSFVHTYSTVGYRVPIWRLRTLVKIWAMSFLL
jgi:hypothetical protein